MKPVKEVAKYDYKTVNKEHLDSNGKTKKKTLLQYNQAGEDVRARQGEVNISNHSMLLEDHEAVDESDGIFMCKNPRCTKSYTRYSAYLKHMSGNTCVTRMHDMTGKEEFVDMYIHKNGISSQYQSRSHRDARKMQFHRDSLPDIDEIFLDCQKEEIYEGHALVFKKKHAKVSEKHKTYLRKIFMSGIETKKKARASDVEIQMRYHKENGQYLFTSDEWLTEQQIKSFWCNLASKIRFPKDKSKKSEDQEDIQAIQDEDSSSYLDALEEGQELNDLEAKINELNSSEDEHPIIVNEINLCTLAMSIKKSRTLKESDLFTLDASALLNILEKIGHHEFEGKNRRKMGQLILAHVEKECYCLIFE